MIFLLGLLLPALACNSPTDDDGLVRLEITNAGGKKHALRVEVAATREQRAKGLSGREELREGQGMLFVMERRSGFWMKDTTIPLDAAFITACGEIVHIVEMEPLSLKINTTDQEYSFGLETNRGWFKQREIVPGSRVKIPDELKDPGCD